MPDVNTRHCVLIVDSIDCTDSVSRAEVTSAESDSDFVSFAQAAAGGARDYALALTLKQNTTAATTLWDIIWSQGGEDVEVEVWPNGMPVDTVPTPTQPQFLGTATVKDPDGVLLGGEANASTSARQVTEIEWLFTAKPVRNVA